MLDPVPRARSVESSYSESPRHRSTYSEQVPDSGDKLILTERFILSSSAVSISHANLL